MIKLMIAVKHKIKQLKILVRYDRIELAIYLNKALDSIDSMQKRLKNKKRHKKNKKKLSIFEIRSAEIDSCIYSETLGFNADSEFDSFRLISIRFEKFGKTKSNI
jgi:hypothetical protein